MLANEKLINQHFFNSVWMLCNNFEVQLYSFLSLSKTKRSIIFASSQNRRKQTSIFSTRQRFFPLFLLAAAKSSLLQWTDNFTILLTLLTLALAVWTAPWPVNKHAPVILSSSLEEEASDAASSWPRLMCNVCTDACILVCAVPTRRQRHCAVTSSSWLFKTHFVCTLCPTNVNTNRQTLVLHRFSQ